MFGIVLLIPMALCAVPSKPGNSGQGSGSQANSPEIVDQVDDTDLYAVPLDTSEAEEAVREQRLEKIQKRLSQPPAVGAKTQTPS